MFEKIMKYPIDVFREGNFSFGVPLPGLLIAVLLAALLVATIWAYRSTQGRIRRGFRGFLIFLRTVVLCLLAFCLLKPFLTIYQSNPDDSYLLVMVDRSKSMQITDSPDAETRLQRVNNLLFAEEEGLLEKLNAKFKVRFFAFDTTAKRIPDEALTRADGESTDIPQALNEALDDLQGIPLSGAVLLTDGVDRSGTDITKFAMQIRERKLPIHTVGAGSETGNPDLEIVKLDVPRTAEEDFPVEIWATVRRKGFSGKKVNLQLTSNGRVLKTEPVDMDKRTSWIPQIGETDAATAVKTERVLLKFTPREAGTQKFEVHADLGEMEAVPQNNTKTFLLKVAPTKRVKILFVDGKPRAEFGFIKRTLRKDPNIQLTERIVTSISAAGRHYFGTRTQAAQNFDFYPDDKETLFDFDAIILGNVDASQFTPTQLENTLEFVRTRGGGLLMLGGSSSLGNHELVGSYINTPLAQCLPVELELGIRPPPLAPRLRPRATIRSQTPKNAEYKLQLTPEGKVENLMALADTPTENLERWQTLPTLKGYSKVKRAKAGALVLAEHPIDRNEYGNRILIAIQNYNAGRVMVFTPHTSRRWQTIPTDDNGNQRAWNQGDSPERFWRQVARWLTTAPKEHIKLDIAKTAYALKEPVVVEVTATDKKFQLTNNAKIRALVANEAGKRKELKLEQVLGKDGLYTARFIPNQYGEYTVTATGTLAGENLGEQQTLFEVKTSYAEFSDAELNIALLKTLAEGSGGKYYAMEEAPQLVNQIPLVESATSKITDVDIWDIPLIFGAVIALLGFEWFLRKRGGLV